VYQQEAGDHRGQAHGQVGDHVDDGQHAGALVRRRERHDGPDRALESAAEPDTGDYRADEESWHRAERHGQQSQPGAGDQRDAPDQHQPPGRLPLQQQDRHRAAPGQHGEGQAAEHDRAGAGDQPDQRRAEGRARAAAVTLPDAAIAG